MQFFINRRCQKRQAKKGINGQELREVVPFGERKGTSKKEQVKRTNYIEKMIKKLIFKQKLIHIHLYMADHL